MLYTGIVLIILIAMVAMPKFNKEKLTKLVIIIPILNAFADVTTEYFTDTLFNPGSLRAILILFIIILTVFYNRPEKTTKLIFVLLIYFAFIISLSSNPFYSFTTYLKLFIALLMFPLGYIFIDNVGKFNRLNNSFLFGVGIIVLQVIIAQLFSLGVSEYMDDSFYLGGGLVQITYTLVLAVILFPLFRYDFKSKKNAIVKTVIVISATIVLFVTLRRTSIIAIPIGLFVYYIYSSNKTSVLKYFIVATLLISLTLPFWGDTFLQRYDFRKESKGEIMEEARVLETGVVFTELLNNSTFNLFFGAELFNSSNYFVNMQKYAYIFGYGRQLHVDYNIILFGGGIIGAFLYFLIYYNLWTTVSKINIINPLLQNYKAVYLSLIVVSLIISLSGSVSNIGYKGALMLYLGAILKIIKNNNTRELI